MSDAFQKMHNRSLRTGSSGHTDEKACRLVGKASCRDGKSSFFFKQAPCRKRFRFLPKSRDSLYPDMSTSRPHPVHTKPSPFCPSESMGPMKRIGLSATVDVGIQKRADCSQLRTVCPFPVLPGEYSCVSSVFLQTVTQDDTALIAVIKEQVNDTQIRLETGT